MQDKAISNEVLARIYGAYLGSPIKATDDRYTNKFAIGKLTGVDNMSDLLIDWEDGGDNWIDHEKCQLILKSIEDVASDEETCFYIAEMFGATLQSQHATRDNILHFGATRAVLESNNLPVADYLRSKSYALPFNGIDLFTAGIAKREV